MSNKGIKVSIDALPEGSPIREKAREMHWDLFLKELKKLRRKGATVDQVVEGFSKEWAK